jgi:hypothetical protein
MVVAASSEDNTGSGAFHKAGLDYLLKENTTQGSQFFGKLSTRAGVSGHSQSGFGAGLGFSHPNVQALVVEGATLTLERRHSLICIRWQKRRTERARMPGISRAF